MSAKKKPQKNGIQPPPPAPSETDQRLAQLEGVIQTQENRIAMMSAMLLAVSELLGAERVEEVMKRQQRDRAVKAAEEARQEAGRLVEAGRLLPHTEVTGDAYVVLESSVGGEVVNLRQALPIGDERVPFLGKAVGDTVVVGGQVDGQGTPVAHKILEIYLPIRQVSAST